MFVFGEDSDTVQTIRDTVDFALGNGDRHGRLSWYFPREVFRKIYLK